MTRLLLPFCLLISCALSLSAQEEGNLDAKTDSTFIDNSLLLSNDTTATDSISAVSVDVINAVIYYDAADSIVTDIRQNKVYLYKNAVVKYEQFEVKAGYIEYDFNTGVAFARGYPDSTGTFIENPVVIDGGDTYNPREVRYNFTTQEAFIKDVVTEQGGLNLIAEETKRHSNGWIHQKNGKITSCTHENPHFYFYLRRSIVVPNDKVVSGPAYLKVRKVPLPLAVPFAWFPTNTEKKSHGIILPTFGNANSLGYFLQGLGYYVPLGDWGETSLRGDIYTRGSWTLSNTSAYKSRYKYNGSFSLKYSSTRQSIEELPDFSLDKAFNITWRHAQDSKARPGTSFNMDINAGSSNFYRNNLGSAQVDQYASNFKSGISWSKSQFLLPFVNLSASALHRQDLQSGSVQVTLPSAALTMSRQFLPLGFLKKEGLVKKMWYEKIGVTASANFDNSLTTGDSLVSLNNLNFLRKQMRNGVQFQSSASTSFKFGPFNVNPNVSYNNVTSFKALRQSYDLETGVLQQDTLSKILNDGWWSMGVSGQFKLFFQSNFARLKNLKALRHVLTPSVTYTFQPRNNNLVFGQFDTDPDSEDYNPFALGAFSPAQRIRDGQSVSFSFQNNLEMKVRDKKAGRSATKKIKLIDQLSVSTGYNFEQENQPWRDISMSGSTRVLGRINLRYNGNLDVYDRDSVGVNNNDLLWKKGKIGRLQNAGLSIGGSLKNSKKKKTKEVGEDADSPLQEEDEIPNRQDALGQENKVDFSTPWSINYAYSVNMNKQFSTNLGADSLVLSTHSLTLGGDVTLFENWKLSVSTGYDLRKNRTSINDYSWDFLNGITDTRIGLHWDLHCWEMNVNYTPFGQFQSISASLSVKSSVFSDIKIPFNRNLSNNPSLF